MLKCTLGRIDTFWSKSPGQWTMANKMHRICVNRQQNLVNCVLAKIERRTNDTLVHTTQWNYSDDTLDATDYQSVSTIYWLTARNIFLRSYFSFLVSRKLLYMMEFLCKRFYRDEEMEHCSMSDVQCGRQEIIMPLRNIFSITHMRGNRSFYPLLSHSNSM